MLPLISHYNLFRSAEINGSTKPGFSSGDAITALKEVAAEGVAARLWLRVFGP
jgi:multidrug efflux pump subunit AcrB